jgi:hypothetical protein
VTSVNAGDDGAAESWDDVLTFVPAFQASRAVTCTGPRSRVAGAPRLPWAHASMLPLPHYNPRAPTFAPATRSKTT